jgi:hypothetical protein
MPLDPCRVRVRLQARTATQAGSVLPEFPAALPATLLPDEKIHRFHLGRYGLGLVLAACAAEGFDAKRAKNECGLVAPTSLGGKALLCTCIPVCACKGGDAS